MSALTRLSLSSCGNFDRLLQHGGLWISKPSGNERIYKDHNAGKALLSNAQTELDRKARTLTKKLLGLMFHILLFITPITS
jgi:hypothetical protein